MESKGKILIVDDEKHIREGLKAFLEKENYETILAENGKDAVAKVNDNPGIDLIIMDIIMPEMEGTESAKIIRQTTQCPILFLTAKSADEDKIKAYGSGGDDYLSKPFSTVELLLRISALLRRCQPPKSDHFFYDKESKSFKKNGKAITLTEKEKELLIYFMNNKDKILTVQEIYENVWKETFLGNSNNTVMVHILNLRKKIENQYTDPKHILTVWGKGYKYED